MSELRHFPVKDGIIDIVAMIGTDYKLFGTLLLEDSIGSIIRAIERAHDDSVSITVEIMRQWLQGKGIKPVTWETLVRCLRDVKLSVMADNIERTLSTMIPLPTPGKSPFYNQVFLQEGYILVVFF